MQLMKQKTKYSKKKTNLIFKNINKIGKSPERMIKKIPDLSMACK